MSTFRLLGGAGGWDARPGDGLDGLAVVDGALVLAGPAASAGSERLPDLLAWSPADRTWWLGGRFGLRQFGPCNGQAGTPGPVRRPV